jgi:hypothetical protein
VAPAALNFHAGAGSSEVLSAEIAIGNTGAGQLTWTASEDAAWLALDAGSGAVPAALLASVNPAGLEPGRTYTATVTINATGPAAVPGSPAAVVVRLSVGNVWTPPPQGPPPAAQQKVYLPLMGR